MKMTKNNFEVVRIAWENGNEFMPMVLLRVKDRQRLDVDIGSTIKAIKGDKVAFAIVEKQFSEYIDKDNVCSINESLSKLLEAKIGDTITITKEVLESDHARLIQQANTNITSHLFGGDSQ